MTGTDLLVIPDEDTTELLDEARRLANQLERTSSEESAVTVVAVALDGIADPDALAPLCPDELLVVERENAAEFESGAGGIDSCVQALASVVADRSPAAVLLPGTPDGSEIAAKVATRVRGGGLTDCLLQVRNGTIRGTRVAYDERAVATYEFERDPAVVSLALEGLSTPDRREDDEPVRTTVTVQIDDDSGIEQLAVVEMPEDDLELARTVVSGGYGLDGPDGFEMLEPLAAELGATLGASRPPVDDGWLAYETQIGVTGKEIDAELYIPCAISGDPYHMDAVEADHCIPINIDPDARIFDSADIGIVGDAYEYVPALTAAICEAKRERTMAEQQGEHE